MFAKEQLDNHFSYHAPTDDTEPKYAAVRGAESAAVLFVRDLRQRVFDAHETAQQLVTPADYAEANRVTREFAEVLDANAPDSADKTAAYRCIRLARNALNEHIAAMLAGQNTSVDCLMLAQEQLVVARWQANSAIACNGK